MMRSREGRQSQPGTAFHTKNTVICHILSRLCLNVTPVLITRLTKLFCSFGIPASVLTTQEENLMKSCSPVFMKQEGEAGSLVASGGWRVWVKSWRPDALLFLMGMGVHLSFVASSLEGQVLQLVTKSEIWCISSVLIYLEKGRLSPFFDPMPVQESRAW